MAKRVVVTDHAFRSVRHEQAVAAAHGASFACFAATTVEEAKAATAGADVAFVNFAPMTREVLAGMRSGGTVVRYGIGYDNVDVPAARELGIHVANVPDYGVETVADHASASLLALARRLPIYSGRIRTERWVRPGDIGAIRGMRSSVVGLVGMGRIAQAVHDRLRPFGFSFVAYDPLCDPEVFAERDVTPVSLLELAQQAHAISLHAPSNAETRGMIGEEFFRAVQPGTVLVNTARGSLVDEAALVRALDEGRIAAVALDVTDPEPVPDESPLRNRDEVLLTPHAAFYDEDSLDRLQLLAAEEAGRALRGDRLRCPLT